jgi:hypothetical protein
MCYGKGLDSKWGGDPTGQHMTADDIKNGIKSCGDIPADKLMLAWSWQSTQKTEFVDMIKELGSLATAGCYAWCKGNDKMFSYNANSYGSCASSPAGGGSNKCDPMRGGGWCSDESRKALCEECGGECNIGSGCNLK